MKKITLLFAFALSASVADAQLFSSGNNLIGGTSVGIGTASPAATLHIRRNNTGPTLFVENTSPTGSQAFRIMNDQALHYATFTKYGSAVQGGFAGIASLYPFASALAFGNNGGAMLNASNQNIGFAIFKNGSYRMRIHIDAGTENVGLGGAAIPRALVHINSATTGDTLKITNSTTGHTINDGLNIYNAGNEAFVMNLENSPLNLGANNTVGLRVNTNGTVNIGTTPTPSGYKLYVEQGILTEKIKVALKTSNNWADYVFADDYTLSPLSEVESFIKTNKHLPGIPSANEVVENGLDLASMDAKLLEKIEELTLHLIRIEKEMHILKQENAKLQSKRRK